MMYIGMYETVIVEGCMEYLGKSKDVVIPDEDLVYSIYKHGIL